MCRIHCELVETDDVFIDLRQTATSAPGGGTLLAVLLAMIERSTRDFDVVSDRAQTQRFARTAWQLADVAGAWLRESYNNVHQVEYKPPLPGTGHNSNPVSDSDRNVETMLRSRLRAAHPDHAIIGEEMTVTARSALYTWVIDPVDGTTNFLNGLPLFAVSIGLLRKGRPLVGAIWCASTHEFRPGVYHAVADGDLQFDGQPLIRRAQQPWRGLAAEPGRAPSYGADWDTRVFGCATLEFAWVAAGLLRLAYIPRPALWDAVAGIALLRACGCEALTRGPRGWQPLADFQWPADLARWSEPLLIGAPSDLQRAVRSA
jgi:myo-inositol-1(or 4)-monophosphatase